MIWVGKGGRGKGMEKGGKRGKGKGAKRVKVGEGITVGKGSWNKGGS
jgi:hypothetical protein